MVTPDDSELRLMVQTIWCLEKKRAVDVTFRIRKKLFGHYVEVVACPVMRAGGTCCAQGCIERFRVRPV
ncbi:MAG: hypothetical protein OEN20_05550 [Gammaproteobacteria bacterium]|nr:hypothetical protein [Gammaproteobacteria bacterium]